VYRGQAELGKNDIFARVLAENATPSMNLAVRTTAQRVADRIRSGGSMIEEHVALLPAGEVKHSHEFVPTNAFGFQGLDGVLSAKYAVSGQQASVVFYTQLDTVAAAKQVEANIRKELADIKPLPVVGKQAFEADQDFFGRFIGFRIGNYIGGVQRAAPGARGAERAQELYRNLEQAYLSTLDREARKEYIRQNQ
jgi:hypothetical protein